MNNLKKLGLTALAGSLVATSVSAGELAVTAPFDKGEVINEADVQTWYNGLNAPETYPWPSLPARFLPAC